MSAIVCLGAAVGCGGGDEANDSIPAEAGNAILTQLEEVRSQFEAGNCEAAEEIALAVRDQIEDLPADVPDDLEEALVQGSDNLITQTREDCEQKEPEPEPEPVPPPTGVTGEDGVLEEEG
jgi:hypothetical protein